MIGKDLRLYAGPRSTLSIRIPTPMRTEFLRDDGRVRFAESHGLAYFAGADSRLVTFLGAVQVRYRA
jgi:hypothetical protein